MPSLLNLASASGNQRKKKSKLFSNKKIYLFFKWFVFFRNRRSGQGDRFPGAAPQYGSESEDDPVLSGKLFVFCFREISCALNNNDCCVYVGRVCVLWRGRVGGRKPEFKYGDEQPHLPTLRSCERSQEQSGTGFLWTFSATPLSQRVSWLLSADQNTDFSATDQVRTSHSVKSQLKLPPNVSQRIHYI